MRKERLKGVRPSIVLSTPPYLDSLGTSNEGEVGILGNGATDSVIKANRGFDCGLTNDKRSMHSDEGFVKLVLHTELAKVIGNSNGISQGREVVGRIFMAAIFDDSLSNVTVALLSSLHSHLCTTSYIVGELQIYGSEKGE